MSKTVKQHERARGLMLTNRKLAGTSKVYSDEEFSKLLETETFKGIDYDQREKFLRANGYALTDANMLDASLSVKEPEE